MGQLHRAQTLVLAGAVFSTAGRVCRWQERALCEGNSLLAVSLLQYIETQFQTKTLSHNAETEWAVPINVKH